MKIGIQYDCVGKKAHRRFGDMRYKKLKEHGFSYADFNMADTDSDIYTLPENESDKILLEEKRLAEEAGVEFSQVHGPWRWPARDFEEGDRAERMEKMKKSIRATSVLGCKNWVIHPIMPLGVEEAGTADAAKTWEMNLEFMRELLKTAKEYGITICFENMPMREFSLATPTDILRFVKEIDDENFKICLDTGHVSVFPDLSASDAVRELGSYIKVLHVHDNRFGWDLHLPPYYGIIDWEDFAKALNEIGFDGVFSLETLPPDNVPDDVFEELSISLAKIAKHIIK